MYTRCIRKPETFQSHGHQLRHIKNGNDQDRRKSLRCSGSWPTFSSTTGSPQRLFWFFALQLDPYSPNGLGFFVQPERGALGEGLSPGVLRLARQSDSIPLTTLPI